jgi:hypothetical protein
MIELDSNDCCKQEYSFFFRRDHESLSVFATLFTNIIRISWNAEQRAKRRGALTLDLQIWSRG